MRTLIDALQEHNQRGDVVGALQLVAARQLPIDALLSLIPVLFQARAYLVCFAITDRLIAAGWDGAMQRMVRGSIARLCGQQGPYNEDLNWLRAAGRGEHGAGPQDFQLEDVMAMLILSLFQEQRWAEMHDIGVLMAATQPTMAPIFDTAVTSHAEATAPATTVPLQAREMQPERSLPPRRVVLAIRERFFPRLPASRKHDLGPRFMTAMAAAGWQPTFYPLAHFADETMTAAAYRDIAQLAEAIDADMVFIDQPQLGPDPAQPDLLKAMRADGRRKVIGFFFDPWQRDSWPDIEAVAPLLDHIWCPLPELGLWQSPHLANKVYFAPYPAGVPAGSPQDPIVTPAFIGGVQVYNWQRALWLTSLRSADLAVTFRESTHVADNLEPMESYERYIGELGRQGCVFNFSMRLDGTRTLTARSFEVPFAGSLLLQEDSQDVARYLVPGRHYLSFHTLGDLNAHYRRMRSAPHDAEAIRQAGHAFYLENYSDGRIIATLDRILYPF